MRHLGQLFAISSKDKSAIRRSFAIHAYVGENGGGKTLASVADTLPSLAVGRPVLSTVQLLNPATDATIGGDRRHPLCVLLEDFRQLLTWAYGDVLLDEVVGIASSRESAGMPVQVANKLVQMRRDDLPVRWTAPAWARADTIIRECSQGVTYCTGSVPGRPLAINVHSYGCHKFGRRVDPAETFDCCIPEQQTRLWAPRRLHKWVTYNARDFDDFTAHKRETLKPIARQWFWGPDSHEHQAYDTFAPVTAVGVANDAGMCLFCGGRRSRPACKCPRDQADELVIALEDLTRSDRAGATERSAQREHRRDHPPDLTGHPPITTPAPIG